MPVNVAMEKPRAWIVGNEAERYIIRASTNVHSVPAHRIRKVVRRITRDANYIECVSMKMERMLKHISSVRYIYKKRVQKAKKNVSLSIVESGPGKTSSKKSFITS